MALAGATSIAVPARAQQDVQAAANAFRQAQQLQLAGDHASAADFYELADSAAPSPEALRSAIRAHTEAGNLGRAATLARAALARYPDDADTGELARATLVQAKATLAELTLSCNEPCALLVDGKAITTERVTSANLFVSPGTHALKAYWDNEREALRQVAVQAGQQLSEAFQAPAPVAQPAAPQAQPEPAPAPPQAEGETAAPLAGAPALLPRNDGLSPAFFWVGAGATAVAGAVTVVLGLDMLDARDSYEDDPTKTRYDDGTDKQTRTNILIGVTGGLAAVTLGLAIFTDWDGERARAPTARLRPALGVTPDGAVISATGAF